MLGVRAATGVSLLFGPSPLTEQQVDVCMLIRVYAHICKYFCVSSVLGNSYLCLCPAECELSRLVCPALIHSHADLLASFPCLFVLLLQQWETWLLPFINWSFPLNQCYSFRIVDTYPYGKWLYQQRCLCSVPAVFGLTISTHSKSFLGQRLIPHSVHWDCFIHFYCI